MSNAETRLYDALRLDGTVAGIVSTRIYEEKLPQDVTYPALVYQRITARSLYDLQGYTELENPHIQVDCWVRDSNDLETLVRAVLDAARAATTFAVAGHDDQQLEVDEPDLYRRSLDISIWNREV